MHFLRKKKSCCNIGCPHRVNLKVYQQNWYPCCSRVFSKCYSAEIIRESTREGLAVIHSDWGNSSLQLLQNAKADHNQVWHQLCLLSLPAPFRQMTKSKWSNLFKLHVWAALVRDCVFLCIALHLILYGPHSNWELWMPKHCKTDSNRNGYEESPRWFPLAKRRQPLKQAVKGSE